MHIMHQERLICSMECMCKCNDNARVSTHDHDARKARLDDCSYWELLNKMLENKTLFHSFKVKRTARTLTYKINQSTHLVAINHQAKWIVH